MKVILNRKARVSVLFVYGGKTLSHFVTALLSGNVINLSFCYSRDTACRVRKTR